MLSQELANFREFFFPDQKCGVSLEAEVCETITAVLDDMIEQACNLEQAAAPQNGPVGEALDGANVVRPAFGARPVEVEAR